MFFYSSISSAPGTFSDFVFLKFSFIMTGLIEKM